MTMMGLGWFGFSTFWVAPLAWRMVTRMLAGERRLFGPGSLRIWFGTLVVLAASATLEALTGSAPDGDAEAMAASANAGGAVGGALAHAVSGSIGWSAALMLMLAVLGLAAPMVFGETWPSLFSRKPHRPRPARAARRGSADEPRDEATAREGSREGARDLRDARAELRATESWESTTLRWTPELHDGGQRHKGIEAVSARRQPAWQPPQRTREAPPQPGEIWLHHAQPPGAAPAARAAQPAVPPAGQPVPRSAPPSASQSAARPASKPALQPASKPASPAASQSLAQAGVAARPEAGGTVTPTSAPRATVVSSPFRQPQLGLRSAITTLPESASDRNAPRGGQDAVGPVAAPQPAMAAPADTSVAAPLMETPSLGTLPEGAAQPEAPATAASDGPMQANVDDVADPGGDTDESPAVMAADIPAEVTADTVTADTVTADTVTACAALREEALAVLADLQALARQVQQFGQDETARHDATAAGAEGPEASVAHAEALTQTVEAVAAGAQQAPAGSLPENPLPQHAPLVFLHEADGAQIWQTLQESGSDADPEGTLADDVAGSTAGSTASTVSTQAPANAALRAAVSAVVDGMGIAVSEDTVVVADAGHRTEIDAETGAETGAQADAVIAAAAGSPADAGLPDGQAAPPDLRPVTGTAVLAEAPAAKPRIVLQAVVGRAVPLVAPQATIADPALAPASRALPAAPRAVDYRLPAAMLLARPDNAGEQVSEGLLGQTSELIAQRLAEFKVPVSVVGASAGPVVTRFEVEPAVGVRGAQVVGLMKDLARALGVTSIRVVETIPGKTCMGLELPNARREMIRLSEIVEAAAFQSHASRLVLAMGKDITGHPVVTDLARAPHLLVAGTTGSGKSVAVNAMILSILYKATPEDVRLIMIDPKMLELSVYEGIPHLLAPVVTDMKQAAHALNWCVGEMEKRYKLMSALGVRNLAGYNQKIRAAQADGNKVPNPFSLTPDAPEPLGTLPLIVVVIDELADLMMVAGKKIEELIARLAQKARAAGIHLILATQRPSVDVITGLIKANIPTRVAFQVSSKIDSRTILDQMGAESLLGQGDMLFLPPGTGYPQRVHGAFVADEEVHGVVEHWKQFGEPEYEEAILAGDPAEGGGDLFGDGQGSDAEADPLYDEAAAFVLSSRRASISAVQRQLRIGYNRAARLIEQMEVAGLVSPMGRNGSRDVLAPGGSD